jgi:hypothetical protein
LLFFGSQGSSARPTTSALPLSIHKASEPRESGGLKCPSEGADQLKHLRKTALDPVFL